jgi:hypothetical protein
MTIGIRRPMQRRRCIIAPLPLLLPFFPADFSSNPAKTTFALVSHFLHGYDSTRRGRSISWCIHVFE